MRTIVVSRLNKSVVERTAVTVMHHCYRLASMEIAFILAQPTLIPCNSRGDCSTTGASSLRFSVDRGLQAASSLELFPGELMPDMLFEGGLIVVSYLEILFPKNISILKGCIDEYYFAYVQI